MKLYDVKVRLGGNILHDVWVKNATAAHIQVLARVHGNGPNDPIAEVKEVGSVKRSDQQERARLRLLFLEWNLGKGEALLRDVLGPPTAPLPQVFIPPQVIAEEDDFDLEAPLNLEDEVIERLDAPVAVISPVRTKPARRFPSVRREEGDTMSPPQAMPAER